MDYVSVNQEEALVTRSAFRAVAILVAAMTLLLSSCFAIRGISLSDRSLSPADRTAIRFNLRPFSTNTHTTTKPFLLIGSIDADRVGDVRFDVQGNWGGPYLGKNTVGLANELLQPGACVSYGLDASELEADFDLWEAWHTQVTIDSSSLGLAGINQTLRAILRVERPAGTANGDVAELVVFSGAWNDTNNSNTYNAGEQISCTAAVFFTIPFVP